MNKWHFLDYLLLADFHLETYYSKLMIEATGAVVVIIT